MMMMMMMMMNNIFWSFEIFSFPSLSIRTPFFAKLMQVSMTSSIILAVE